MNFALLYDTSLRKVTVLSALVLTLAGCATSPRTTSVDQAEDGKAVVNRAQDNQQNGKRAAPAPENVQVDPAVIADFNTAMKYLKVEEYEKGAELLKQLTQRAPSYSAPYINLAMAYEKMGKLAEAEKSIKKALELEPGHPIANTEYALLCRKAGRFAEAREVYERTLKRYPTFLPARKNLGILCDIYLRDLKCALTQYRAYSAAMPNDETVQIWIADLEKRQAQAR
jgi:Tfp pilus assembly protein PilF